MVPAVPLFSTQH